MVRKSADFILDNNCALRIAPEDWGHGHLLVNRIDYLRHQRKQKQLEANPATERRLGQFLIDRCQAILWHTQEFYEKTSPDYPLDKTKRNVLILKGGEPKIVHPKDRNDPSYATGEEDLDLRTRLSLTDVLTIGIREHPQGQIETKRGRVLIFIPPAGTLTGYRNL